MPKNKKYAIGVDLGGTSIKAGIVSSSGEIINKTSLETKAQGGPSMIITQIQKGVKEILRKNKYKIEGIGIGSPGVVSSKKGTVENPPNLPGWEKVNLGKILRKEFTADVYVENDANAAAIGEMIFGAGKKYKSFVMITLGTGVGGGIIINNKLYRGEFGAAGEIGHITIDFKGPKCNCGSYGCIETFVGNNYMISSVKSELKNYPGSKLFSLVDYNLDLLSPKIIGQAAKLGDEFSVSIVRRTGSYIGYALASVCNLLDISTIIVGGGVAGFGKLLFDAIEESTKERVLTPIKKRIKILDAKLKNNAGIKGASALVFYKS